MRWVRSVAMAGVLLASSCAARAAEPAFSFSVHGPHDALARVWAAPDGSLVILSGGPLTNPTAKQTWELQRVTGWAGGHPQEQALTLEVGYGRLPPDHEITDLSSVRVLFDPTGRYVVIRLSRYAEDAWSQSPRTGLRAGEGPPESIVDVVDLKSFRESAHQVVTDPVLAVGDLGFNAQGVLVVNGLAAHTSHTDGDVFTDTGQWVVDTVRLPELTLEPVCRYTKVVQRLPVVTRYDPAVERQRRAWYQQDGQRVKEEQRQAEASCAPGLEALGYASLVDLHDRINEVKQEFALGRLAFQDHAEPESPLGCRMESLSADRKYLLYDCDQSRVELTMFRYYRARRVYAAGNPKPVLELGMPHGAATSGVLAAQGGVDYFVLLRGSDRIEGYRLP